MELWIYINALCIHKQTRSPFLLLLFLLIRFPSPVIRIKPLYKPTVWQQLTQCMQTSQWFITLDSSSPQFNLLIPAHLSYKPTSCLSVSEKVSAPWIAPSPGLLLTLPLPFFPIVSQRSCSFSTELHWLSSIVLTFCVCLYASVCTTDMKCTLSLLLVELPGQLPAEGLLALAFWLFVMD